MPLRQRTEIARRLRADATDVERQLWRALREAGLPYRVRRQRPVGRFVVDFAIPARKLAVELDGAQQASAEAWDGRLMLLHRRRLSLCSLHLATTPATHERYGENKGEEKE